MAGAGDAGWVDRGLKFGECVATTARNHPLGVRIACRLVLTLLLLSGGNLPVVPESLVTFSYCLCHSILHRFGGRGIAKF